MKYELRQMLQQGGEGYSIVNCSSIGGLIGMPGRVAYHASKHAVLGMTKCAALEYAAKGIRINAVCPATISTPMVEKMMETGAITDVIEPIGRFGTPEEVAGSGCAAKTPDLCLDRALLQTGGIQSNETYD